MNLISPYLGQITYKIEHQNAKFWTCFEPKLQEKGGSNNLIFSIGFQMLKIYFFQISLNTCEMWSSGVKTAFFPKNYKKMPSRWGFRPQNLSMIRLNCVSLLNTAPILDIFTF